MIAKPINVYIIKFVYAGDLTICAVVENGRPVVGYVHRYYTDRPSKSAARKYALTEAIRKLPREMRKEIWDKYFSIFGKGKK